MSVRYLLFGAWWRTTLSLLALLAVIAAVVFWLQPKPDPDARWRTVTLARGPLSQRITATGTLQPTGQVSVGTQVSGTVAKVLVDFNQEVKSGQVLAEIDPSLLQSALKQASAGLQNAQAQLSLARDAERRNRTLLDRAFISQPQMDSAMQQREAAQAQVEVASAQVERAQTDLRNAVIRSPVAGVVIARKVDVGQTVAANFQIPDMFVLARDLREMEIHANVSEADVGGVKPDLTVEFRVDAFNERTFMGKVRQVRLNAKNEQGVVTYNVVITADNAERLLLPGMTARVEIVAVSKADVLRLPNAALRFRPNDESREAGGARGAKPGDGRGADQREGRAGGQGAAASSDKGAKEGAKGDREGVDPTAEEARIVGRAAAEADAGARVYRLKAGNAERVDVRTGISDGRFTELVDGALVAGERVIIRDLKGRQAGDVNFTF